jgi:hypothetical protein
MRTVMILGLLLLGGFSVNAAEEKIRGVLEKTAKAGACAQITDALSDVYYVTKTDQAEKAVADYVGKNVKVVVTGTAENREGDPANYLVLKAVEPYTPKMPPAPPPEVKKDEQD